MRLPFPTHISLQKATVFAAALFVVQQIEHTQLIFSGLIFFFILISTLAFNAAGGFSRPSGAYIFWFVTLVVLIGVLGKAFLGEPAETNLEMPVVTMATYGASVIAMWAAVVITRPFTRNSKGIGGLLQSERVNLEYASLGCMVFAVLMIPLGRILPTGSGSIVSFIYRLNLTMPLGIILGVLSTVRKTRGRHSINLLTGAAMIFLFVFGGLVTFSKQGLLTPLACWIIPACASRYRLRLRHIVVLVGFGISAFWILGPLSEVGRSTVPLTADTYERVVFAISLMTHPTKLRKDAGVGEIVVRSEYGMRAGYYDKNEGFLDRLTMMPIDSGLIAYTVQGHQLGMDPVIQNFENWFPHFILPHKVAPVTGNFYAHEIGGLLSADDFTTGISFSPTSELFHWEGWFGLLVLGPFLWGILFLVSDFICGDLRVYPWGLVLVLMFGHIAPEMGMGGAINYTWLGNASVVAVALFSTLVAPIIGSFFAGQPTVEPLPVLAAAP